MILSVSICVDVLACVPEALPRARARAAPDSVRFGSGSINKPAVSELNYSH